MPWTVVLIAIGAVLPIVVAAATIFLGTRDVSGSGRIVRATCLGIALGAIGGALVSALVIVIMLILRAAP